MTDKEYPLENIEALFNLHTNTMFSNQKFKCILCTEEFRTDALLNDHYHIVHHTIPDTEESTEPESAPENRPDQYTFRCSLCDFGTLSKQGLAIHIGKTHKLQPAQPAAHCRNTRNNQNQIITTTIIPETPPTITKPLHTLTMQTPPQSITILHKKHPITLAEDICDSTLHSLEAFSGTPITSSSDQFSPSVNGDLNTHNVNIPSSPPPSQLRLCTPLNILNTSKLPTTSSLNNNYEQTNPPNFSPSRRS